MHGLRTLTLALALATPHHSAPAHSGVYWTACRYHLDWATMTRVTGKECTSYAIRRPPGPVIGYWTAMRWTSPHVRTWVKFPEFARSAPAPGGYQARWLVTWYAPTGRAMADGQMPFLGAAACGYDVRLGTRVAVPGIGTVTCLDRIGANGDPWQHVDVFDRPLGSGDRLVAVYP